MKKLYTSPIIEIESYDLSSSIAAACQTPVRFGPGTPGSDLEVCSGFEPVPTLPFPDGSSDIMASFYSNDQGPMCDCYYTAGGEGYFSS